MSDREWFEVVPETAPPSGQQYPNEEAANAAAQEAAAQTDGAVCVVRHVRTEVRSFRRAVTVSSTDMTTSLGAT